jgi:hypothetical protein
MCQRVFWKALPEHNPEKLDSHNNSYPTASEKLNYTKYAICQIKYYCRNIAPKITKLVGYAS